MANRGSRRWLILGGRDAPTRSGGSSPGWHLSQLIEAASRQNGTIAMADYESMHSNEVGHTSVIAENADGKASTVLTLESADAVLTRTMPAGTLEQITFRLACLHRHVDNRRADGRCVNVINPPVALEWAIDKYATLARATALGLPTPRTIVCQSRQVALDAFDALGGDVVVKPIFGGEGRGVMRIRDRELAWTTFSTLAGLGAVCYVQQFIPPGGGDVRLLVIGDSMWAIRRTNPADFRTNVRGGGRPELISMQTTWRGLARRVCDDFQLDYAAVDLIETHRNDEMLLVEVNAIPGWRGAQSVIGENLADEIIACLRKRS